MAITKDINGVSRRVPELGNSGWGTYTTQMLTALIDASLFTGSGDTKPLVADLDLGDNYGVIAAYIKSNSSNLPTTGKLRLANGDIISWRNAANDANIEVKIDSSNRFVIGGVNVPTISSSDSLTNKTIDADNNTISNLEVDNLKAGVLDTDLSDAALTDTTIPSAKATKAYVDAVDTLIDNHIIDTTAAHAASAIGNTPSGNVAATDVQAAINELQSDIDTRATAQSVTDHLNDTTAAHAASAISNTPSGNLAATDVQAALNELQSDVDARVSATSPTIDNGIYLNHETSVTTPASGKVAVFPKSDNNLYVVDSNGVETQVGSGSGQGEKNYISNGSAKSAITGWANVGDLDVARTTTAAELPREYTTASGIKITADANTQSVADYVYYDFSLDDVDLNKKLKITWAQKMTGTYASGNLAVVITSQADRTTALHTPVTTSIPNVDGVFTTSFDSASTAALSLVIRATTDMATDGGLVISDVVVGPGSVVTGAVVGPATKLLPSVAGNTQQANAIAIGAVTTAPAIATTVVWNNAYYYRSGSYLVLNFDYCHTNSAGASAGTGGYEFRIPSGLTIDSSILSLGDNTTRNIVGAAQVEDNSKMYTGTVQVTSSTILAVIVGNEVTTPTRIGSTFLPFNTASNYRVSFEAKVPIAEWAGSGTVNLGQNDVEYAASTTGTWDADAAAGNTVYGPVGALISGSLTANRSKVVRFSSPIQVTDKIVLEFYSGGVWREQSSYAPYIGLPGIDIGCWLYQASGTDVTVVFFQYYRQGTTFNSATGAQNWTNGVYWRVRKTSAGAAVAFGLATSTSSGLINYYDSGSFTCYLVDGASAVSAALTCYYTRVGNVVTLKTPGVNINNATTARYLTTTNAATTYTWPTALTPSNSTSLPILCRTGTSTYDWGVAEIISSGIVILTPSPGTVWTGSSVPKGVEATSLTYTV